MGQEKRLTNMLIKDCACPHLPNDLLTVLSVCQNKTSHGTQEEYASTTNMPEEELFVTNWTPSSTLKYYF